MRFSRTGPLTLYFVLAYVLAWLYWIPLVMAEHGWISLPWSSHAPGLVAPLLAALAVTAATEGRRGLRDLAGRMVRWRIGIRWTAFALSPVALFAAAALILVPFGSAPAVDDLGRFDGIGELGPVGIWLALVVVNGLGEETGWRGFAHDRLNAAGGDPRRAVGIVAALWAGWHLPLFFFHEGFEELAPLALPGWFIGLGAGAVVLAWLYERSGRSILAVAVWHGSYNWAVATDAGDGAVSVIVTGTVIAAAVLLTRRGDFTRSGSRARAPRREPAGRSSASWPARSSRSSARTRTRRPR